MNTPILIDAGSSGDFGWHGVESFLKCQQLFAYGKILNIRGPPKEPLVKGAIAHVGLAHRYARMWCRQNNEDQNQFYTSVEAMKLVSTKAEYGALGAKFLADCINVINAYESYYATERVNVLSVEEVFGAWVGPEGFTFADPKVDFVDVGVEGKVFPDGITRYPYTQRMDFVYADDKGKAWTLDHKSCGRMTDLTVTGYTMSGQFFGMAMLGRLNYGKDFGGVKANLFQMPPKIEFKRVSPNPAPNAAKGFAKVVYDARREIARLKSEGLDPWSYSKALSETVCVGRYGVCPNYSLCQWGPGSSDGSGVGRISLS